MSDPHLTDADREGLDRLRRTAERAGVRDPRVLDAVAETPRRLFIPPRLADLAYDDAPLPIGGGQTISQPSLVARMTEALALTGAERVLEIGAGSGYQTALLSKLAARVYAIERLPLLGEAARERLRRLGCENVELRIGDGSLGWPEAAPFDRILAAAAAEKIPQPLLDQLAEGGVLLLPVGPIGRVQRLIRVRKTASGLIEESLVEVRFVPLVAGAAPGSDGR